MKKLILLSAFVFASCLAQGETANEIMQKNYLVGKVADSASSATFTLVNSSGQERVRKVLAKTKLAQGGDDEMRYVKFNSPADIKGTATLLVQHGKSDDDMWIYLPAVKKVRRLLANNKRDSFIGTDFSYADVMLHKVGEWNHKLLREETIDKRPCYVIESVPKDDDVLKNSGYSKRIGWIDKSNYVLLAQQAFDESGKLLKKISATDVKMVDAKKKKYIAMRITAENVQSNHKTIIALDSYKANVGVSDDYFSANNLDK